MLDLTISVDHDIVDGAPAARFARRLAELVEQADGLWVGGGTLKIAGQPTLGELAPPFPGAVEFSLQQRTFDIVHIEALSSRHRVIPVAVGNLRR